MRTVFKKIWAALLAFAITVTTFLPAAAAENAADYSNNLGKRLGDFATSHYDAGIRGQCAWYCRGRSKEKLGLDFGNPGNANTWYTYLTNKGYYASSTPVSNSIICWNGGEYGHVAFCEYYDSATDYVYFTEANWPADDKVSSDDGVVKRMKSSEIKTHCSGFQGYVCLQENATYYEDNLGKRLGDFATSYYDAGIRGQCAWYCRGRSKEKLGLDFGNPGNANTWYTYLQNKGYSVSSTPVSNSIICWNGGQYGHVAYCEYYDSETGYVYLTEANWTADDKVSTDDGIVKRVKASAVKTRCSGFQGYVCLPVDASNTKSVATDFARTVKDGVYTFKSVHSGKMLNVYDGKNADGTKLTTWDKDGTVDQQFEVKYVSDGKYLIYATCSNNTKVIDVNIGSNGVLNSADGTAGDKFDIWTRTSQYDAHQLFYIVPRTDGSFVFELASAPRAVMSSRNADHAETNGGDISLRPFYDYNTQKWYFYDATGTTKVDPSVDSPLTTNTYEPGTYTITEADGLNIRSNPGTSYSKLGVIPCNTTIEVTRTFGTWGETIYGEVTGWVCLDYTYCAPSLTSISVYTLPYKEDYYIGDTLDISGLTIKANYSNGSSSVYNSGFSCSPATLNTAGTQKITVTFDGKTTSFNVNVAEVEVTSIAIASYPTKLHYYEVDRLDTDGLALTVSYNNGTTKTITSGFTCSPAYFDAGTQTVTVTYGGKTATFDVYVTAVEISSITIRSYPTKMNYYVGDTLDTTGLMLSVIHNNGMVAPVATEFTCSPTTLDTAGTQKITVTFGGKTTSFYVNVAAAEVTSIAIASYPTKTDYYVGETLDTTGLMLSVTHNNGFVASVGTGFTFSRTTLLTAGTQEIIVTYEGKTTSFFVNVAETELMSIAIVSYPTKTNYYVGDTLDTTGLTLEATYSNGAKKRVSRGFTCSTTKFYTAGTDTVTVYYGDKFTSFKVKVAAVEVTSIAIESYPVKTNYYVGDTLSTGGLYLEVTYNNGTTVVYGNGFTCSPTLLETAGTQEITVRYTAEYTDEEITTSFTVFVAERHTVHSYGDWLMFDAIWHVQECECGEKAYSKHTWDGGEIYEPATPTKEGIMTYTCTGCGATKTEPIKKPELLPSDPQIQIGDGTVRAGETVTLPITMKNVPDIKSILLDQFVYDRAKLQLIGFEWKLVNALLSDWDAAEEVATIAFGQNIDANGVIAEVTFRVLEDTAEGDISVSCDIAANQKFSAGGEKAVTIYVADGCITVKTVTHGDVNGDDFLDSDDAIYLLRYSLNPDRYPVNQDGDMNGDGFVDSDDAIYLLRHTLNPDRYPLA